MNRRDFVGCLGAGVLGAIWSPGGALRSATRNAGQWGGGGATLDGDHFVERWSWAMGQPVHLQLFAQSDAAGYDVAQAALAELRRVERHLSLFDDVSDLCELNRRAGHRAARFGPDLTNVLTAALEVEHETGGAFNPAIEPLMRTWGFHRQRTIEPTPTEIAEARAAVLAARVLVKGAAVTLPERDTRLDLGGIAVGYGLDRAIGVLRAAGITRAFLDLSGDCYALGAPPGETGWRVDIADPIRADRIIATTRLRDAALATSSNQLSVVRYGRILRGHVMDPATGWPADRLRQVSVVARSGIEADALSTAMLVSGRPVKGVLRWYAG